MKASPYALRRAVQKAVRHHRTHMLYVRLGLAEFAWVERQSRIQTMRRARGLKQQLVERGRS